MEQQVTRCQKFKVRHYPDFRLTVASGSVEMVSAEAPGTFTMAQFVASLVSIVVAILAVGTTFSFSMRHVQQDVSATLHSLDSTVSRSRDSDVRFTEQIGGLCNDPPR
jgi:hypothetical protein